MTISYPLESKINSNLAMPLGCLKNKFPGRSKAFTLQRWSFI